MSWGRRVAACALLPALPVLLTGCGDGGPAEPEPTPVVIPGSTVTIGTEPSAPSASAEPSESSAPSDPPATPEVDDPADLLAVVGEAMGAVSTVHLSVGRAEAEPVIEADHQYLDGDDYGAQLAGGGTAGAPADLRRVDDVLYARLGPDEDWQRVDDLPAGESALLAPFATWNVLTDLRDVLDGARDFAAAEPVDVDGTTMDTYTFTVDAADLVAGAVVPDDLTGTVEVTFSVDAGGRPARVDQTSGTGETLRTEYGEWGADVDVEVPPLG